MPPATTKRQLDAKGRFVRQQETNCDPDDEDDLRAGDQWDSVAVDPDSRLLLSAFAGKRLPGNAAMRLPDVQARRAGTPELLTRDAWPGYPAVVQEAFGEDYTPPRPGEPGRPAGPRKEIPAGLH